MALEWKYSAEAALLRRKGMRTTRRRVDILRFFSAATAPLSAETLHTKLRGMDRATVYRTLSRFADAGLLNAVNFGGSERRFERAGAHHHHLVCTSCEKVEELQIPEKDIDRAALKSSKGFSRVSGHSLEFFGICRKCA